MKKINNNYLDKIDKLINDIIQEYDSPHETMTKIINYEYYTGQLHAIYNMIEEKEPIQEFIIYYEYRKNDRDNIDKKFNEKYITPVYSLVRNTKI